VPSNTRKAVPTRKTLLYSVVELYVDEDGNRVMVGLAKAIFSRLITYRMNLDRKILRTNVYFE
jgi:hypothetical protein